MWKHLTWTETEKKQQLILFSSQSLGFMRSLALVKLVNYLCDFVRSLSDLTEMSLVFLENEFSLVWWFTRYRNVWHGYAVAEIGFLFSILNASFHYYDYKVDSSARSVATIVLLMGLEWLELLLSGGCDCAIGVSESSSIHYCDHQSQSQSLKRKKKQQ